MPNLLYPKPIYRQGQGNNLLCLLICQILYSDKVKAWTIPHITNLRIKDLVWFIENKCDSDLDYLPDYVESKISIDSGSETYVINYTFTLLGNTFNKEDFDTMIFAALK